MTAAVPLRVGQVAATAGVNLQTVRYYERRGLLPPPERTLGGHRVYPAETITVLRVIKAAQRLGFTLSEVADLLETGRHQHARGKRTKVGLAARAAAKLAEVETRLTDLTIIRDSLRAIIAAGCEDPIACATSRHCPVPFSDLGARDQKEHPPRPTRRR